MVIKMVIKIFSKIVIKIVIKIFSKILQQIGRRGIGLYALINCFSPFWNIGVTVAGFNISG